MYLSFLCERKLAASFPFCFFSVVPMVIDRTERGLLENRKGGYRSNGRYRSCGSTFNVFVKVKEPFTLFSLSLFPKVREPSCSSQKTHAFHTSYKKATKENNKMFVEDHLIAKTDGVTPLVSIQKQRHHLLQIQFSNSKLFQIFENSTLLRNFKLFYMQVVPT
jgi:hypothetical protein